MSPMAKMLRSLSGIFYLGMTLAALSAAGLMALFFVALADLPRVPEPLSRIIETPPTEIFAATGERIMVMGGRRWVPLSRVSPHFIRAVVATEDHRFWEHKGINKLRTLKALQQQCIWLVGTAGEAAVRGDPPLGAAHHLHQDHPVVCLGGGREAVDGVGDDDVPGGAGAAVDHLDGVGDPIAGAL